MARNYGSDWGAAQLGARGQAYSCDDLGSPLPAPCTSSPAAALPTVREAKQGAPPEAPKGRFGGVLGCGTRRAALRATREELEEARLQVEDLKKELAATSKQADRLETENHRLKEQRVEVQEKALKEVREARGDGAPTTPRPRPDQEIDGAPTAPRPRPDPRSPPDTQSVPLAPHSLAAAHSLDVCLAPRLAVLPMSGRQVANARAALAQGSGAGASTLQASLAALEAEKSELLKQMDSLIANHGASMAAAEASMRAAQAAAEAAAKVPPPSIRASSRMSSAVLDRGASTRFAELPSAGDMGADEIFAASRLRGKGVLRVHLAHAHNLLAADSNGKSDPYAVLRSAGSKKTSKIMYATLDPVWAEDLELKGSLNAFVQEGLYMKLWDKDSYSRDDPLGDTTVPLTVLRDADHHTFTDWPLPTQGTVTFSVTWVPTDPTHVLNAAAAKPASRPAPTAGVSAAKLGELDAFTRGQMRGKLKVHLVGASKLISADSNGLSDPYCKVSTLVPGAEGRVSISEKRTKTIKKSLNPTWNETLEFEGKLESILSYGVMIRTRRATGGSPPDALSP